MRRSGWSGGISSKTIQNVRDKMAETGKCMILGYLAQSRLVAEGCWLNGEDNASISVDGVASVLELDPSCYC